MGIERDVQTLLQSANLIDAGTWKSYVGAVTDEQDKIVEIRSQPGPEPNVRTDTRFRRVQVRVRGAEFGYDDAKSKVDAIYDELDGHTSETINGTRYVEIRPVTSNPNFMGYDDDDRPEFTMNFEGRT